MIKVSVLLNNGQPDKDFIVNGREDICFAEAGDGLCMIVNHTRGEDLFMMRDVMMWTKEPVLH